MSDVIDPGKLKQIVEAALMAADEPLTVDQLTRLFAHGELDSEEGRAQIRDTLQALEAEAEGRGYELKRVASGYRYQVRHELAEWVSRLWEEKPPRYSRALLETLALVAYKQPVTRGDIEEVRGVAVSQNIMRTLLERGWIRVVGQREVPGKPSLYGTTKAFLDYFNLKSLDQLPPLAEIRALIEPLVVEESPEPGAAVGEPAGEPAGEPDEHAPSAATSPEAAEAAEHQIEDEPAQADAAQQETEEARNAEPADESQGGQAGGQAGGEEARGEEARDEADEEAPSAEIVRLPTFPRR